jgi:hypothetical protein
VPLAWDRERESVSRSRAGRPVAFDYDGTLTPIVEDDTKAFLTDDMRRPARPWLAATPSQSATGAMSPSCVSWWGSIPRSMRAGTAVR